eukprot:1092913-Prymnesium_polylepis.1
MAQQNHRVPRRFLVAHRGGVPPPARSLIRCARGPSSEYETALQTPSSTMNLAANEGPIGNSSCPGTRTSNGPPWRMWPTTLAT